MKSSMIGLSSVVTPLSRLSINFSGEVLGRYIYLLRCSNKLKKHANGDNFIAVTNLFTARKFGRC
jgi:hypothetical protein